MKKIITKIAIGIAICTLPFLSSAQSINDSLQVYYRFSGNISDSSGNGYHLSALSGSAFTFVTDRTGTTNSAIKFTGSNGLKSKYFTNKGWTEETFALWYKQSGASGYQVMFQGANLGFAAGLRYLTIDQITVFMDGSSADAFPVPCVPNDTFWHHLAITNNSSVSKIYWDGIYAATVNESLSTATGTTSSQFIYVSCSNSGYAYKGVLDEIRLYNRVLSDCEIRQIYNEDICPIFVYDTITTQDTNFVDVKVYDTTFVTIYDTLISNVFDTTHILVYDTTTVINNIDVYDTTYVTRYDTTHITRFDTTFVTVFDTITITRYDTIRYAVADTLYVDIKFNDSSQVVNQLKIYPNPARDHVLIDLGDNLTINGNKVILYNIIGQKIDEKTISGRFMDFDLSGYAKGHYELVFTGADNRILVTKRIVLH